MKVPSLPDPEMLPSTMLWYPQEAGPGQELRPQHLLTSRSRVRQALPHVVAPSLYKWFIFNFLMYMMNPTRDSETVRGSSGNLPGPEPLIQIRQR